MTGQFLFSSGINKFLMSPVVNLMVKKERYEGDFRFQHVFIRVNSESLAFYGKEAESVEERALDKKLGNWGFMRKSFESDMEY